MKKFTENPQGFISDIGNLHHHHSGWMACLEMMEGGRIDRDAFDLAASVWLNTKTGKMRQLAERSTSNLTQMKILGHQIREVVCVVTNKPFPFPHSLQTLRRLKEALLGITVTEDGGHWENSLKVMLRKL